MGSTEQDGCCAQGHRFKHITSSAYTAIEQNWHSAVDRLNHIRQREHTGHRAIQLSSAVIRDDDGIQSAVDRL